MSKLSFSPWPSFTQEEADAVQRVLLSNKVNYWTGVEGREFEREFAAWTASQYAVAVANGTVAIDLALIALGIKAGDEVIVTRLDHDATQFQRFVIGGRRQRHLRRVLPLRRLLLSRGGGAEAGGR